MITDLPTKRIYTRYHSGKHFSEFLPTRWLQKSTGIDMEQNYVTVTVYHSAARFTVRQQPQMVKLASELMCVEIFFVGSHGSWQHICYFFAFTSHVDDDCCYDYYCF